MERQVSSLSFSLFLSFSLSLFFSLFLSLSLIIYLPTYRSIYLATYLPMCLSIYLSIYLFIYLSIHLSIYLSIYRSTYLSFYLRIPSIYLPTYLSIYLSVCLSIYLSLSLCLSVCLSIYLSICKLLNQRQKRNNSARFLRFLNLTTSKTKQFCETSSIFELDNIKNKTILRDILQKWKVECSADSLVPMRFAIFLLHLSKVLRLPRKIDAKSYEVLHLSRKIVLANLQIWCSKMQPLSGNERPDLLTSLMNMSFLCFPCPGKCIFADPLQKSHACHSFWKCYKTLTFCSLLTRSTIPCTCHAERHLSVQKWHEHVVSLTFWLRNVLRATTACTFSTSQLPKVVRAWCVLHILTWKCASRHNGVHFFDISTSKSGPTLVCFVHFDLELCFAPQRRALFRHLNFQKWSESGVFCTFWLRNVLRATTAYNFSSLIWPAGSAPAALASLLFDPPEPQIIGKTQCFATCYLFAHLHLLSSDSFSSTLLSSNLSLLSASALLCFSSVHIVGSLFLNFLRLWYDNYW